MCHFLPCSSFWTKLAAIQLVSPDFCAVISIRHYFQRLYCVFCLGKPDCAVLKCGSLQLGLIWFLSASWICVICCQSWEVSAHYLFEDKLNPTQALLSLWNSDDINIMLLVLFFIFFKLASPKSYLCFFWSIFSLFRLNNFYCSNFPIQWLCFLFCPWIYPLRLCF